MEDIYPNRTNTWKLLILYKYLIKILLDISVMKKGQKPNQVFASFLKKGSRQEVGKLVQFITGHCNLLKHQFRIGKSIESQCRLYKTAMETPWHLVTECKELKNIREKLFQGQVLHSFSWSPQVLLRFCKESSIWSLLDGQD